MRLPAVCALALVATGSALLARDPGASATPAPVAAHSVARRAAKSAAQHSRGFAWQSWDAGLEDARLRDRPVLVDVYTDWCGWCRRMDRDVYARSDVQQYLGDHFVTIRMNAESQAPAHYLGESTTLSQLAGRFGVDGYPTTIFLTAGGSHLANMPGYFPADKFLLLLNYVGDGALARGVPFEDFAKSKGVSLEP